MIQGTIDSAGFIDASVLVVDCELLFDVKIKWLKKSFIIKDSSAVVSRYMYRKDLDGTYDRIIICCIDNFNYREKILRDINIPYELIDVGSESNYKNWLWTVMPDLHLAIKEREMYYANSISINKLNE